MKQQKKDLARTFMDALDIDGMVEDFFS